MDIREQVNDTIQQTQGWIDWPKGRILNLLGVSRTQQYVFHQPKPAGLRFRHSHGTLQQVAGVRNYGVFGRSNPDGPSNSGRRATTGVPS